MALLEPKVIESSPSAGKLFSANAKLDRIQSKGILQYVSIKLLLFSKYHNKKKKKTTTSVVTTQNVKKVNQQIPFLSRRK